MQNLPQWLLWAGLSAVFAALTALFAKVGVKGVDSDLAMAIRTLVVAAVILPLVVVGGRTGIGCEHTLIFGLYSLALRWL